MSDITRTPMTRANVLAVTVPKGTNTYKPVAHQELIDLTLNEAAAQGFTLKDEHYKTAYQGSIVTGYFDFMVKGLTTSEMGLRVAWQNSYNRMVSLKYAIGANVFVCTNGSFYGDQNAFKKLHVGDVQTFTPATVKEYFLTAADTYQHLDKDKNLMKEVQFDKKVVAALVGDMYLNENLIKDQQLRIIRREIANPSFDYQADGSAWQLYGHVTHSLKSLFPSQQIDAHKGVHDYFMKQLS